MSDKGKQGNVDHPREFDRELDIPRIMALTIGLLLLVVVSMIAMGALFGVFEAQEISAEPPPPVLEEARKQQPPPGPRLQPNPPAELISYQDRQQARLHSYGWTDRDAGMARIPIERAIELVAERGLPQPEILPEPALGTDEPSPSLEESEPGATAEPASAPEDPAS